MMITLYVIYDHPRDYPEFFVARRWFVEAGVTKPDEKPLALALTLDTIRRALPPVGLKNIGRESEDDAAIVEVWV